MLREYDLVYHCDSRPEIGNGHLKRGIDILHALRVRNRSLKLGLCGRWSDGAKQFIAEFLDEAVTAQESPKQLPLAKVAVLDTMHRAGDPGFLDPQQTATVRDSGQFFVIVSSALEPRLPVMCDLFIDHLPDVVLQGVMPREAHYGFMYAPVGLEFFEPVEDSGSMRDGCLVAVIGGAPEQHGPELLARAICGRALTEFAGFTMVVSPHYPAQQRFDLAAQYPGLELLQGVPSLAPLLRSAAAVICTYGNIAYESLSCGAPTFLLSYLPFQDHYGTMLEKKGLVIRLGKFNELDSAKVEPLFRADVRDALAIAAQSEFTRPGIELIADELLELLEEG